jgi:hypothetical protein
MGHFCSIPGGRHPSGHINPLWANLNVASNSLESGRHPAKTAAFCPDIFRDFPFVAGLEACMLWRGKPSL